MLATRSRRAASLFAALGLLLGPACRQGPPQAILITVDSLRADHVRAGLTPSIEALMRDGVVFQDAVTNSTTTLPSHASMLSGFLPGRTGVVANDGQLSGSTVSLPEILRRRGFATGAVISSFPLRSEASGLNRGFDAYDEAFNGNEENRTGQLVKTPEETTRAALAWVDKNRSKAFFLWVHYFPPHGPYSVAPEYLDPSERPTGELLPISKVNYEVGAIPAYQRLEIPPDAGLYRSRYAGRVRQVDAELGRLLDALRAQGVYGNATIILTADHGESLGEHNHYFCHGDTVYQDQARIPMVLKLSKGQRAGSSVRNPVEAVDIFPTFLQALQVPVPSGIDGLSILGPLPRTRARFTASTSAEVVSVREGRRMLTLRIGPSRLLPETHPGRELFFLDTDPLESQNLIGKDLVEGARLERAIRNVYVSLPAKREISSEVEERLKALGYIR